MRGWTGKRLKGWRTWPHRLPLVSYFEFGAWGPFAVHFGSVWAFFSFFLSSFSFLFLRPSSRGYLTDQRAYTPSVPLGYGVVSVVGRRAIRGDLCGEVRTSTQEHGQQAGSGWADVHRVQSVSDRQARRRGHGSSAVIRDLPGWPGRAEGALGKREKRDGGP